MITQESLERLSGAPLAEVRHHVREILEATPSFRALDTDVRRNIAKSMVEVMAYMVHPSGGDERLKDVALQQDTARAFDAAEDAAKAAAARKKQQYDGSITAPGLPTSRGQVGNQMEGKVAQKAGDVMAKMVKDVDFPKFVASLIDGVFTSIVDSSIKQMKAFGDYLKQVAMTVQDFANQNVHPNEARDSLAAQHPQALETTGQGANKKLKKKSGASDEAMPNFKQLFGLDDADPDDEESELQIVQAHQLTMARQRQQMLATMVLMGINRIVVTDGEIKATVQFDVKGTEDASSTLTASTSDQQSHRDSTYDHAYSQNRSFWGTERSGSSSGSSAVNTRVASAASGLDEQSTAHLEAKAKLTGLVHIKFKSETFPLEKLASQVEFDAVQASSKRQ